MFNKWAVMLMICVSLAVYVGTFTALVYAIDQRNTQEQEVVTLQHIEFKQLNFNWSNWVRDQMGICLVNHYPHMADAKQCMIKKGIMI